MSNEEFENMTSEELALTVIRCEVNGLYDVIKGANADLDTLREKCPHTHWRVAEYSWAPGHTFPARVCDYCDKCLGQVEDPKPSVITTNT